MKPWFFVVGLDSASIGAHDPFGELPLSTQLFISRVLGMDGYAWDSSKYRLKFKGEKISMLGK